MATKYVKDFSFDPAFGFSGSNQQQPKPVHKAVGGPLTPQQVRRAPQPVAQPAQQPGPTPQEPTITMPMSTAQRLAEGVARAGMMHGAQLAASRIPGPVPATPAGALSQIPTGAPGMKKGGRMAAKQRHALPKDDFALPNERYPINDKAHARNALARVAQHGNPEEQATVRAKVHRKFPGIVQK
jgi:hypothetical protein